MVCEHEYMNVGPLNYRALVVLETFVFQARRSWVKNLGRTSIQDFKIN